MWAEADMVVKVKEPLAPEFGLMRRGQVLFTYLHLAASLECTEALLSSGVTAIAYETVERPDGSLPLLAPMSEVAGRLATQVGAHALQATAGGVGRGILLGGVPGVPPGRVVVIGAGSAGTHATAVAVGRGERGHRARPGTSSGCGRCTTGSAPASRRPSPPVPSSNRR